MRGMRLGRRKPSKNHQEAAAKAAAAKGEAVHPPPTAITPAENADDDADAPEDEEPFDVNEVIEKMYPVCLVKMRPCHEMIYYFLAETRGSRVRL